MTTQPAPLLTAELADSLVHLCQYMGGTDEVIAMLQALADKRTVNVRVMSEKECRAEFEAHWCPPDHDETPGFEVHKQFAWDAWLACARAMGAVR